MAEQAMRAADVIRTLRALVRTSEGKRIWQDPHALVQSAIRFIEPEVVFPGIAIDAVRARPDGSHRENRLTTRARSRSMVEVRVTDNGHGIGPSEVDHLFDEFFTTKEQGLGLGLSISRSIVESHGGSLWLQSTSPVGTMFCFTLPASQP
jgi:two-component system sensor kinase FixL